MNNSASHFEFRKYNTRVQMIREATSKIGGVYLYDNLRGADGGRAMFDGGTLVVQNGQVLKEGDRFSLQDVEVLSVQVDLQAVRSTRISKRYKQSVNSLPRLKVAFQLCQDRSPTIQAPLYRMSVLCDEDELGHSTSCFLWDYLRRAGASAYFLPLSGGADSAATATIVFQMCSTLYHYIIQGCQETL